MTVSFKASLTSRFQKKKKKLGRKEGLTLLQVQWRKLVNQFPVIFAVWHHMSKREVIRLQVSIQEEVVFNEAKPLDLLWSRVECDPFLKEIFVRTKSIKMKTKKVFTYETPTDPSLRKLVPRS
jgi:hypothetical protein